MRADIGPIRKCGVLVVVIGADRAIGGTEVVVYIVAAFEIEAFEVVVFVSAVVVLAAAKE
jgi:hypothetical protein